jgi:hypothetical protein
MSAAVLPHTSPTCEPCAARPRMPPGERNEALARAVQKLARWVDERASLHLDHEQRRVAADLDATLAALSAASARDRRACAYRVMRVVLRECLETWRVVLDFEARQLYEQTVEAVAGITGAALPAESRVFYRLACPSVFLDPAPVWERVLEALNGDLAWSRTRRAVQEEAALLLRGNVVGIADDLKQRIEDGMRALAHEAART